MKMAISFSRQNHTASRARTLSLLGKLVLVLVVESEGLFCEDKLDAD